jgi:hypothetical protein
VSDGEILLRYISLAAHLGKTMMDFLRDRKTIIFLEVCFFLLFFFIDLAHSLILPPDPFESTERYALLSPASGGTITQVLVKVKAGGEDPLGPGELWALFQYKQASSGSHKFHFAASKPVPIQGLSNSAPTLIEFDFSNEPIPAEAYHRTLLIHYQETPDSPPVLLAEYRPEQLHLGSAPDAYQPPPPPPDGTLIFGPVTVLRKRGAPKTEQVSFSISDATGPFLLRLTKGRLCGAKRATRAWVKLNGSEVFRPSEFKQDVAELSRQVTLLSGENLLEVRLRGVPGSFITLELFRLDRQACPVLDAHTFKRSKGKPLEETLEFELGPQFIGPFTLHLTNGTADGYQRVDSAKIKLNGRLVFEPHDFNEQVKEVSRTVSLVSKNKLRVELRGAPGDFLTLWIVGYDHTPPIVTIVSPLNGAAFSASPIAVSGTVDDASASVTVNGITAHVGSDGSFSVEGITLEESDNPIRVVATDMCGNQGEEQILVYLRTVPQGPYLLFCAEPFLERPPSRPEEGCDQQRFARDYASIAGSTDETAVSVTVNGVLFPDGKEVSNQGDIIDEGIREGTFFWAYVKIPQVDGDHAFTAVVTNTEGGKTEATVYFFRDTVPPKLTVTSPTDGLVTSNPEITITGTVDDPEAMVRLGWYGPEIPVVDGSFAATDTLPWEGSNNVTITARDPAGNNPYVSRMVILDTQPPQINVTYPAEGLAVNTSTLNVTGNIIDENINEVTVSVNGSKPQTLTLTGVNFSGVANLVPGQNTLTFHAVDKAGNTASVTRSVSLDVEVPAVTIITPLSGVLVSGVMNITVEASDVASGIMNVTLYVGGQAQTTLNQAPFNFTLDTSMLPSGLHTITVRALDGAGNQAEASVNVTVDNIAPIVAITSPGSGAFVSGWITVSVQASDAISGIGSVSLYLGGLLQATLTQPPFDFPLDTLQFASGSHTISARGIDILGNQGEASVAILFDHEAPSVTITAPVSGAMVSGAITVSVEATDSISGVATVTLYVDNQPHSALNQLPFSFSIDTSGLVPGSHTLAARATDQVGNQAEASIIVVVIEPVSVEITSPSNGVTINKSSAIVQGKIYNQMGEIGVVVNGALAEVQGSDFAVILPLQPGQNIITATATRPDGVQGQASITINTETQQEFIRLTATPTSGILDQRGILNVTFEAAAYLGNPVSSYTWDFNGDGTPGTEASVTAQYQYPGIYFPTVTVTDTQGNAYTETTIVHVLSREAMDALLRSKWEGMKTELFNQEIPAALDYFIDSSKQVYQQAFSLIIDELPQITSNMQDIEIIFIFNNVAKYRINRIHNIDGILQTITYYVYFARDLDGIWRIDRF